MGPHYLSISLECLYICIYFRKSLLYFPTTSQIGYSFKYLFLYSLLLNSLSLYTWFWCSITTIHPSLSILLPFPNEIYQSILVPYYVPNLFSYTTIAWLSLTQHLISAYGCINIIFYHISFSGCRIRHLEWLSNSVHLPVTFMISFFNSKILFSCPH